jgi:segregation and condensation protein B
VRQPVRQSIIVRIIGNKAYDYVKELQEKGFIKATKQGNTKLLDVTPRFESYFGKKADEIKKAAQTS